MLENLVYVSTLLVAGATVFLVWLTSKYVRLTKEMVDEMRVNREPSVFLDLEIVGARVNYSIGNLSPSPAINVQIKLQGKNIPWLKDAEKSNSFTKYISYLPPNRTYRYRGGIIYSKEVDEKSQGAFYFDVSYFNENGKKYNRDIFYKLNQYSDILFSTFYDPMHNVTQAISNLERSRSFDRIFKPPYKLCKENTKKCEFCYKDIAEQATKCPHCLEMQNNYKQKVIREKAC